MRKITQLWLVGKLEFSSLIIIDVNYWLLKLYISINNRDRMRTKLITKGILGDIWSTSTIKDILSMLANKAFINSIIRIMPEDESKVKVVFLLNNGIFSFTYNIKTTIPGQFPNPRLFYNDNFQADTSMAVEI